MLLLQAAAPALSHPLAGTVAEYVWLLPILPLFGFLINGALSLAASYHPGPSDPDGGHGEPNAPSGEHGAHGGHGS
jgi:hypothetical protein